MPLENEGRLDLGCIVGNIAATIVTRCGIVYQGTILDFDCGGFTNRTNNGSPDSEDSNKEASPIPRMGGESCRSFIRMQLSCTPGNICCAVFNPNIPLTPTPPLTLPLAASRVTPILGFSIVDNDPLYEIDSIILINWDDVASIGSIGSTDCLTPDF